MARLSSGRWLLCRALRHLCAMPIENAVEIMRPLPTEPLAGAPPFVLGLAIVRGRPLPVVDMGHLLGGQESHPGRFVTVRIGERQVALALDGVLGVHTITSESLYELPPLLRDAGWDAVDAIGSLDAELLLILRHSCIVPDEVWATIAAAEATR